MLATSVPITHAEPVAPPAHAQAALDAALVDIGPQAASPHRARVVAILRHAAADLLPLEPGPLAEAFDRYVDASTAEELDPSENDERGTTAARQQAEEALWDAPAVGGRGIAAKIALAFSKVHRSGMLLDATSAEEFAMGREGCAPEEYALAHAYRDCMRLGAATLPTAGEPIAPWAEIAAELKAATESYKPCLIDSVALGREPTAAEYAEHDNMAMRDLAARDAAYAYEPLSWSELALKSAALNAPLILECDAEEVAAALAQDIARLADADGDLVANGKEALRLLGIYTAAEQAESEAWNAWSKGLPRTPDELRVRGIDFALRSPRGLTTADYWATPWVEELRAKLPAMRERTGWHPESQWPQELRRSEQIVSAHDAHEAAKQTPEHEAAHRVFLAAQQAASEASEAADPAEVAVIKMSARTVAGLAAKARLLLRMFSPVEGETMMEIAGRTFLQQVIAADEGAA